MRAVVKTALNASKHQRGAVSIELALGLPLLIHVIVGGVHFGRVLMIRHKLGEATSYATRAAAVARTSNASQIRGMVQRRMGSGSGCTAIRVTTRTRRDPLGFDQLEVTTTCDVNTGIGGAFLGPIGPDRLDVTAAMPF